MKRKRNIHLFAKNEIKKKRYNKITKKKSKIIYSFIKGPFYCIIYKLDAYARQGKKRKNKKNKLFVFYYTIR